MSQFRKRMEALQMEERRRWLEWLAEIGYGFDFTHDPHPPCTVREFAEVANQREPLDGDANPGETGADVHVWVIESNTGWADEPEEVSCD